MPLIFVVSSLAVVLLQVVLLLAAWRALRLTSLAAAECSSHRSELTSALAKWRKASVDVAELGEVCERLEQSVNKWRGRAASNAKREAASDDLTNAQGAEWKEKMRKKLRIGTPAFGGSTSEG